MTPLIAYCESNPVDTPNDSFIRELAPAPLVAPQEQPAVQAAEPPSDWKRLCDTWDELGYDCEPPKCMGHYVDALIEAMRR